jgi:hypothetical protein
MTAPNIPRPAGARNHAGWLFKKVIKKASKEQAVEIADRI